jgi:hypothetical protein
LDHSPNLYILAHRAPAFPRLHALILFPNSGYRISRSS